MTEDAPPQHREVRFFLLSHKVFLCSQQLNSSSHRSYCCCFALAWEEPGYQNGEEPGYQNGEDPGYENGEDPGYENGEDPGCENWEDSGCQREQVD